MTYQKRSSTTQSTPSNNISNLIILLSELGIGNQSKIELWLSFKGIKPVSAVSLTLKNENDTVNNHKEEIINLKNWLKNAKLNFKQDTIRPEIFYVSQDPRKILQVSKIMWKEDGKSVFNKGTLFGYPPSAVKLFSDNIEDIHQGKVSLKQAGLVEADSSIVKKFKKYWKAYMRYTPRSRHFSTDSLIAKKWADVCRKDIPKIAYDFEKTMDYVLI